MDNWQRIKVWRKEEWERGSLLLIVRRRDAPGGPTYSMATRIPRELRENILHFRGKCVYRRYIRVVVAAMRRVLEDDTSKRLHYVRPGEATAIFETGKLRMRSLAEIPNLRRHRSIVETHWMAMPSGPQESTPEPKTTATLDDVASLIKDAHDVLLLSIAPGKIDKDGLLRDLNEAHALIIGKSRGAT